jgi:hypothetical protein
VDLRGSGDSEGVLRDEYLQQELALGRRPGPMERRGSFQVAANFMLRSFEDRVVTRVPREDELERVRERFPGAAFKIRVKEGDRLSALEGQDSYSFELANLFLGAQSRSELLDHYDAVLEMLPFEVDHKAVVGHVTSRVLSTVVADSDDIL